MTDLPPTRESPRKWLLAGLAIAVALVTTVTVATPASAVYWSGGMWSANYTVKNPGFNSTWMTPINAARGNWNASCGPCDVIWNPSAAATIAVINQPNQDIYGRYISYGGGNFRIELNQPRLSGNPPFASSLRSGMAHEMGHSFSLGDYPDRGNTSLMSYTRDRHTIYYPTRLDLAEVEDYY